MRLSDAPPPSAAEFEDVLDRAVDGWIESDTGLPDEVEAALDRVRAAGGDELELAVDAARAAFARSGASHP